MNPITFTPEPNIAEWLNELASMTGRKLDELISLCLQPWLSQMIGDGDTGLLKGLLQQFDFETKEEARIRS
jgi:hypothetical protein